MSIQLPFLDEQTPVFPDPETALTEPDGLLAAGGNLSQPTLLSAYSQGIFPWYETGQPILWWSPKTRMVLEAGDIHVSRSLQKVIKQQRFEITTNQQFHQVITNCAASRNSDSGTWITNEMIQAYRDLHQAGNAHSIEIWQQNKLIGGLYGVAIGGLFCGESMFSHVSNASKIALVALTQTLFESGFSLIDCQLSNPHLSSMGCREIPRQQFLQKLNQLRDKTIAWPARFKAS